MPSPECFSYHRHKTVCGIWVSPNPVGIRLAKEGWQHSSLQTLAFAKCTTMPVSCLQRGDVTFSVSPASKHGASAVEPMETCHLSTPEVRGQWQSPGCAVLRRSVGQLTRRKSLPTFIVVVFHGEDTAPRRTSVIHDGFDIQWLDCERIDDPDWDPFWRGSQFRKVLQKNSQNNKGNTKGVTTVQMWKRQNKSKPLLIYCYWQLLSAVICNLKKKNVSKDIFCQTNHNLNLMRCPVSK